MRPFDEAKAVKAIEDELDRQFEEVAVPGRSRAQAAWAFLTVVEDMQRWSHCGVFDSTWGPSGVQGFANNAKFAAKHGLNRIWRKREWAGGEGGAAESLEGLYDDAIGLLQAGVAYEAAVRAFSRYQVGMSQVRFDFDRDTLHFRLDPDDSWIAAAEMGIGLAGPQNDDGATILTWFRGEGFAPEWLLDAARRHLMDVADAPGGYFDAEGARRIAAALPMRPQGLPAELVFMWGDGPVTTRILDGLVARVAYHGLVTHLMAAEGGVGHGFVDRLVLLTTVPQLAEEVASVADVDSGQVSKLLETLVYGAGVESPDPALQMIVPLDEGFVAIPPIMVMTSNVERNLLSLMARVDPRTFDQQSACFERHMVRVLREVCQSAGLDWNANFHVPGERQAGEVDFMAFDRSSRVALVIEARWMIQPAENREVVRRYDEIRRKCLQAERKCGAVRRGVRALVAGDASDEEGEWLVRPLVVLLGMPGAPGERERVPVLPLEVLGHAIASGGSLREILEMADSGRWRPTPGREYDVRHSAMTLGPVTFEWPRVHVQPEELRLWAERWVGGMATRCSDYRAVVA